MSEVFEITGWGTVGVAGLLAVLAVTGVVRSWGRLAAPGLTSVLLRVVSLLLVTVMIALAVAVTVNRTGLWFVSWRDLGSVLTGPTGGQMRDHGAAPVDAAGANLGPWAPAAAKTVPSPAPRRDARTHLATYRVTGPASGHTGTVYVWQPPASDKQHPAGRSVLQVFHGFPVSSQSAFTNLALADHLKAAAPNTIVVIPDWSPGELDTECVDGPKGKMETWLTTDIPAWAVATLGARPERSAWATLGYSAGGYCATMTAMRHPTTYAAAVSLGGYTRPVFGKTYRPFPPTGGGYDLPLLAQQAPPSVAVLAQFSKKDIVSAPSTEELLTAAQPPLAVTSWSTPDAGHRVGAWKPLIPQALTWLTHTLPEFA